MVSPAAIPVANLHVRQVDAKLVEDCAARKREAWTSLVTRYQTELLAFVYWQLRRHGIKDLNVGEEVLSNIWFDGLNGKWLHCYQSGKGDLRHFFRGVANRYVKCWMRDRTSRTGHQKKVMGCRTDELIDSNGWQAIALAEFLDQASPSESAYLHEEVLKDCSARELTPHCDSNLRVRRHRLRRSLCRYLGITIGLTEGVARR